MADPHLDHPGDISWWPGHGPLPVLGACPHTCDHSLIPTIAYGPDHEHYCLVRCDDPDGCAGQCRGWAAEYPYGEGPQLKLHGFKQVRVDQLAGVP